MVKDEVLRLAREANLIAANNEASTWSEGTPIYPELHSFAGLVTERIREDWHPHVSEAILACSRARIASLTGTRMSAKRSLPWSTLTSRKAKTPCGNAASRLPHRD
jgi:hypothetical protein